MKKIDIEKIAIYDFSNLNSIENSTANCFGCDSCDCNCDCDSGDYDCNDYCDTGW